MLLIDIFAYYLFFLKFLLMIVAGLIIISSIDDLFIDILYWVRVIYRALFIKNKHKPLDVEQLYAVPQKPFVIMIPAWEESSVIKQMVDNTISTYDYSQYSIFVGVYQNDKETQLEVNKLAKLHGNVHMVIVPRDGPTCKADCLNWIIQGVMLYEKKQNMCFAGIVMHDAEDVVHRLELRLFNYLVDRKDLMQLPVFSLERPWYELTAGHYIDEFAESHSKDLLIREMLIGAVPSAGVATCFSRKAIDALALEDNTVFNTDSLTEDYDISFKLKKMGMKQIFLQYGILTTVRRTSPFTGKVKTSRQNDYVATREFFPNNIKTAMRQKARWVLGIVFQGWKFIGWQGNLATRYMLFRDRKGVLTSFATFIAYFLFLNGAVIFLIYKLFPGFYNFPPLLEIGTLPWWLVIINLFFLTNRIFHRMLFTGKIYGWEQSLLSIPRLFVGNFINFLASVRAMKLFASHIITSKPLVWDKTDHSYPSASQLQQMKQKLGEVLIEKKLITEYMLNTALKEQKRKHRPIGEILLEIDALPLSDLVEVLAAHLGISNAEAENKLTKRGKNIQ